MKDSEKHSTCEVSRFPNTKDVGDTKLERGRATVRDRQLERQNVGERDRPLLCVHSNSELSYQITGSHSLSMGKSDQSHTSVKRYQRQKVSVQSDQRKMKTA